jgi:hypothetical protein
MDGEELGLVTGPVRVPAGAHRLHIESGGFTPADRDVTVPLGRLASVSVVFEPTPETRSRYVHAAESRRVWSWATLGIGAALTAAGATLAILEQGSVHSAQNQLATANFDMVRYSGRTCDPAQDASKEPADCPFRVGNANAAITDAETKRAIGWGAAGLGGATMLTGLILLISADDPHRYDERPLLAGWQIAPQGGIGRSFFVSAARTF